MNNRVKFKNLDDVRAWKQLKKDELDLAKLNLEIGKQEIKKNVVTNISKFIMIELALVLGQKTIFALVKKSLRGVFVARKSEGKKVV